LRYEPQEQGLYLQLSAPAPPNPSHITNNHFSILDFQSQPGNSGGSSLTNCFCYQRGDLDNLMLLSVS